MTNSTAVNLRKVIHTRNALSKYRDDSYIDMLNQLNTQAQDILKDDLGAQFIKSCGRDLAGEVVRNFFDTSDFHITVDQLAMRILEFDYKNEYDPLKDNSQIHKNVYNYNEVTLSSKLKEITRDMDNSQEKLFLKSNGKDYDDKKMIEDGKKAYKNQHKNADGSINDDLVGNVGNNQDVDHVQSLGAATYNAPYIREKGVDKIKEAYNSEDNFNMVLNRANQVKNDVRVLINEKGEPEYLISSQIAKREEKGEKFTDITHKVKPEQYAEAVISKWENTNPEATKVLKENGYLNEDGKVPKHIKNKLVQSIRRSQNAESKAILINADYGAIGKDALTHTKKSLGKIIAGQIIYYAAPPLVFEIRGIIQKKPSSLKKAMDVLSSAGKRICDYIFSKLKSIFADIAVSSLKNFIKVFMDILINLVKATIKKILKLAKNLVMATVDAVRILAKKDSSGAEKADAVCNLFGVTITTFAVDVLFDMLANGLHIPDFLLMPLQILTTVVCTNLTMLMLQKADLFDVRFGFKIQAIRDLFEKAKNAFNEDMAVAESYTSKEIEAIIEQAKGDCLQMYSNIMELNPYEAEVRGDLNKINLMFGMGIDFDAEWLRFIGIEPLVV